MAMTETPETPDRQPDNQIPIPDPAPEKPTDPRTFKVKVDDKELQVTEEELIKGYQLESAARARLEEAAKQRKAVEKDVTLAELTRKAFAEEDIPSMKRLLVEFGKDTSGLEELEKMNQSEPDPTPDQPTLPPEVQEKLKLVDELQREQEERKHEQYRQEVFTGAEKRVDSDDVFGKMEDNDRSKVKKYVRNEVMRLVGLGYAKWPDVLDTVIPEARDFFKDFSTRKGGKDTPGFNTAPSVDSDPQPKEPPKPVNIEDPKYDDNFRDAFRFQLAKLSRKREGMARAMKV